MLLVFVSNVDPGFTVKLWWRSLRKKEGVLRWNSWFIDCAWSAVQGLSESSSGISNPSQHIWTTLASFKPSKIKTAQIKVSQQHICTLNSTLVRCLNGPSTHDPPPFRSVYLEKWVTLDIRTSGCVILCASFWIWSRCDRVWFPPACV